MNCLIWNWKSAVLGVALKTPVFLATTAGAGFGATMTTGATDVAFRAVVAGLSGSLTQWMSQVQPRWFGTLGGLIVVPAISHGAEALVHSQDGTPHLGTAIGVSVALSILSTTVDLYAMRRGALVVGAGSSSLLDDLCRLPGLWLDLLRSIACRLGWRRAHEGKQVSL